MQKFPILLSVLALLICARLSQASDNSAPDQAKPSSPLSAKSLKGKAVANVEVPKGVEAKAAMPQTAPAAAAKKPGKGKTVSAKRPESLGEAFITQGTLQIHLDRPVSVTLYNARGQMLFHLDSFRPMEALPLKGVNAGFLYVTLRAGQLETTQKLVYTGK